jgi:hypothetical protein
LTNDLPSDPCLAGSTIESMTACCEFNRLQLMAVSIEKTSTRHFSRHITQFVRRYNPDIPQFISIPDRQCILDLKTAE